MIAFCHENRNWPPWHCGDIIGSKGCLWTLYGGRIPLYSIAKIANKAIAIFLTLFCGSQLVWTTVNIETTGFTCKARCFSSNPSTLLGLATKRSTRASTRGLVLPSCNAERQIEAPARIRQQITYILTLQSRPPLTILSATKSTQ